MRYIDLIPGYEIKKTKTDNNEYKAKYNRLLPTKMSSSNLLLLYILFFLDKKSQPLYGAEILTEIQKDVSADVWTPSHGTFYPLLEKMEKAKYIVYEKAEGKNFYSITELGKEELKLRLVEFKHIVYESSRFFSNILAQMYNEGKEDKLEISVDALLEGNKQVVELITSLTTKVEEIGTRI